jgi:hypothetical protein
MHNPLILSPVTKAQIYLIETVTLDFLGKWKILKGVCGPPMIRASELLSKLALKDPTTSINCSSKTEMTFFR